MALILTVPRVRVDSPPRLATGGDSAAYKVAKEAFYTGHSGGSSWEIVLVTAIAPVSVFCVQVVQLSLKRPGPLANVLINFLLVACPLHAAFVLPDCAVHLMLGLLAATAAAAAAVGMQVRDRILEIEVTDGTPPSGVRIEIQRGAQRLELELPYVAECAYSVSATIADQINAHVASDSILVSTGLLRFVEDDDELAFAIGHELAHRILGHRSSRMRSRERAADRMGTELAASAGYDPAAAVRLVRRLAAEHPEWIGDRASPGHPGTAHRVAALEAVVEEIVRRTTPAGSTKMGDDQARSSTSAGQSSGGTV